MRNSTMQRSGSFSRFVLCLLLTVCGGYSVALTRSKEQDVALMNFETEQILNKMSIEELIGQMTQINIDSILHQNRTLNRDAVTQFAKLKVGSYLNSPYAASPMNGKYGFTVQEWRSLISEIQDIHLKVHGHPIVYGLDSVHGTNYLTGAVMFGQQINAAATFNPELVEQMGRITGRDTESAGISWIFGPILDIATSKAWARVYETFGEDPYVASQMGKAIIQGIQKHNDVAACFKHFIGYSATPTGHDRDPVTLGDYDLLNYYAPSFKAAIESGVLTGMENYVSVNGVPMASSKKLLNDLLRRDLNFKGMLVTDWAEINNLHTAHHIAKTEKDAVRISIKQTSIDMSMVPDDAKFVTQLLSLYNEQKISYQRIRESAKRVIRLKQQLNLYNKPVPGEKNIPLVGNVNDTKIALELARESIVLLKNENVLPLKNAKSVFLTGPSIDNIGHLCGGWTIHWQGASGNHMFPHGQSIQSALKSSLDANSTTTTFRAFEGVNINGVYSPQDLNKAIEYAKSSEYTIVTVGEGPYAEKTGDINDLSLSEGQVEYVRALSKTGTKLILVLVQGRPRLLKGIAELAHAVIHAMLPCEFGGQAIAEVLTGLVNPSGKLPITYPKNPSEVNVPYYHRFNSQCSENFKWFSCPVQWKFGSGLSYTKFAYSNFYLSSTIVTPSKSKLQAHVTISNIGDMDGKETVLLFITQPYREHSVPEVKMLKKFQKIYLRRQESKEVIFDLDVDDWSVYIGERIGQGLQKEAESGDYFVAIGADTECQFDLTDEQKQVAMCKKFTWNL